MTSKPRLKLGSHLVPGLAAVALFFVMALAFAGASFPSPEGFGPNANVTASIGYAMFDLTDFGSIGSEGFLAAFIIIAIVLDAAIDAAVFLAKREEDGSVVTALTDGGRDLLKGSGAERGDGRSGSDEESPSNWTGGDE
ncbi:proton-conducting membrane transporter [Halegenticoccus tardaugens]|uniref:proton-conducting membrane transporter n=1 Tax=Halegenticoccus tardaugens TaxID=2071624 RepID=UPI00100B66CB|nr:proton-conducting membrane transporter [Halegenticoccus tardaugens]